MTLVQSARLLEGCSPLKVISRGYAVVRDAQGNALSSVDEILPGQMVQIGMQDGALQAKVESVKKAAEEQSCQGQQSEKATAERRKGGNADEKESQL